MALPMIGRRSEAVWKNWAGEECRPRVIERPLSRGELVDMVGIAASAGRQVTVAGSGHSFTGAPMTDDVMIDLSGFSGVLDADRGTGRVKVLAGTVLEDLAGELDDLGLALPNLGDIDCQTLAGGFSTGTHGTGEDFQNLAAQVVEIDLVTAAGEVLTIDEGDAELLRAARIAIGSLGVIVAATIQAVPAFNLHREDIPMPLDQALAEFDRLAAENDHFEFFVFPYSDTALTLRRNRTDREPQPRSEVEKFISDQVIENGIGDVLLRGLGHFPQAIPGVARFSSRFMAQGEQTDTAHRLFVNQRSIRFNEMEYCLPREEGLEALALVLKTIEERRMPLGMPVECRVLGPDQAMLSPSFERPSIYVAVHQHASAEWEPWFRELEPIFTERGGRPHWGKHHTRTAAELAPLYPEWDAFQAVRDGLDPERTFTNAYLERVLGP
ncbi:MAG: D-arabinono-1,4-lactone oxidase [Solirubrobacterales bacterium]